MKFKIGGLEKLMTDSSTMKILLQSRNRKVRPD